MQQSDPFPIEYCSSRLRNTILTEFRGRCPTLQEVLSISSREWLGTPGMGRTLLMELEAIMKDHPAKAKSYRPEGVTEAQLLNRLERLQRELKCVRNDFLALTRDGKGSSNRDNSSGGLGLHRSEATFGIG